MWHHPDIAVVSRDRGGEYAKAASVGAPQVGQKAPDFTLSDTSNKPMSLAGLLTQPINGKSPKGVLLIFYRGYW